MKPLLFIVSILLVSCSGRQTNKPGDILVIDSSWKQKKISPVLTMSLPDSFSYNQLMSLNAYMGQGKSGVYGVDYFDTVVVKIRNEADFRDALKGYLYGKFTDPRLMPYDFSITDTSIGNSNGYFLTGFKKDSGFCTHPFCYLTSAGNNMYYFYACQSDSCMNNETRQFFHSIEFDKGNFTESGYKLEPVIIHKPAKQHL